jgi:hypothetical protein
VISHIAMRRELWPYFRDDQAIAAFWELGDEERRRLWGARVEVS